MERFSTALLCFMFNLNLNNMKKFIAYAIDQNVFLTRTTTFDAQEWERLEYVIDYSYQSHDLEKAKEKAIQYIKDRLGFAIGTTCYYSTRKINVNGITFNELRKSDKLKIMDIIYNATEQRFKIAIATGIEDYFIDVFQVVNLDDVVFNVEDQIKFIVDNHNGRSETKIIYDEDSDEYFEL